MITLKLAEKGSIRQFNLLWKKYMTENFENGEVTLPTDNNLKIFTKVARHYMNSPQDGCVAMAFAGKVPVGVAMWGAYEPFGLKTSLGNVARGWGTYIVPEHRGTGISRDLRTLALSWLKKIGINTVIGGIDSANAAARESVYKFGFEPLHTVVIYRIKED